MVDTPAPEVQRDVAPPPLDPEFENHAVIKACRVLLGVHSDTLRRIDAGSRYTKTDPETGVVTDTTDLVKEYTTTALAKVRELMEEVRLSGCFTRPAVETILDLQIPTSEKAPAPAPAVKPADPAAVDDTNVKPEELPATAEQAALNPDDILKLPGE